MMLLRSVANGVEDGQGHQCCGQALLPVGMHVRGKGFTW